ncbi:pyridoxamine 5'-phosphate oxidase [Rhizobiales bacterium]|uniref:RT0821/Lpp0805 family surface protein n=1 Tax=Hongsoonwoonella zoysiae TaxID=2821844 RepID=UPI00155FF6F0|nr:RT0821/Lpp0805 family surface protein [Hongsoonwoonella zoysiae]NRG19681.1 pyridoxamine 5'-phosphate oxidase [Hongsoonwoonella zoysiae]
MLIPTYTAKNMMRQFRFAQIRRGRFRCGLRVGALIASAGMLAACGSMPAHIGSDDVTSPLDLTGSIDGAHNTADADIGIDDRKAIAFALAVGPTSVSRPAAFTWSNPVSGNSGTIISLKEESVPFGTECSRFETTANTIGGVRAYTGLACRDANTNWTIVDLRAKDATLEEAETAKS